MGCNRCQVVSGFVVVSKLSKFKAARVAAIPWHVRNDRFHLIEQLLHFCFGLTFRGTVCEDVHKYRFQEGTTASFLKNKGFHNLSSQLASEPSISGRCEGFEVHGAFENAMNLTTSQNPVLKWQPGRILIQETQGDADFAQ